ASADNPGPGDAKIVSVTGSAGVAKQGAGVGIMAGVNVVTDTVEAYFKNSTLTNPTGTGVTVKAEDNSWVFGIGAPVAIGTDNAGVGAALASNTVTSTVRAYLDNSDVKGDANDDTYGTGASDGLTVEATNMTVVSGLTVAGAGSKDLAVAANVHINLIINETSAYISSGSEVKTAGKVYVHASDESVNVGLSGSVGISGNNAAVGAALATNDVINKTKAHIDASQVESTASGVE